MLLLKKFNLFMAMFTLVLSTSAFAHESKPNTIPYNLHNEEDDTDALAIPSDTTELEQEDEMQEMNQLQKPAKK